MPGGFNDVLEVTELAMELKSHSQDVSSAVRVAPLHYIAECGQCQCCVYIKIITKKQSLCLLNYIYSFNDSVNIQLIFYILISILFYMQGILILLLLPFSVV